MSLVDTNNSTGSVGAHTTYRLEGSTLILEPTPREAVTGGLSIDISALPAKLTGDGDKIDLRFPITTETLLVYDVYALAMGQEEAQSQADQQSFGRIMAFHQKLEASWLDAVSERGYGRSFGAPFYLGD